MATLVTLSASNSNSSALIEEYSSMLGIEWSARTLPVMALLIGLPGNLIIFLLFYAEPCGLPPTVRIYYATMALLDFFDLFVEPLIELLGEGIPQLNNANWIPQANSAVCKAVRYVWLFIQSASNWIMVVFCVERIVVILLPFKSKTLVTKTRCVQALIIIFVSAALLNLTVPFVFKSIYYRVNFCMVDLTSPIVAFYDATAVVGAWLPVFIEAISAFVLGVLLIRSTHHRHRVGSSSTARQLSQAALSTSVTLAILAALHVTFYAAMMLLYFLATLNADAATWIPSWTLFTVFYVTLNAHYVQASLNFLILALRMPLVRYELKKRLSC